MSKKILSHSGLVVHIGIDVHKETYKVVAICADQVIKTCSCAADPRQLSASLTKWFDGAAAIKSAYEAGYFGFGLHRALLAVGIDNIVVNAASIPTAANDRVKTDRRDATKIALELSKGTLRGIYVPTIQEELARLLHRSRAQIVELRATVARMIKAKLHQFGLVPLGSKREISSRYLRELEGMLAKRKDELEVVLKDHFDQWRFFTAQLLEARRRLAEQAQARDPVERVYRSVPGMGPVSAAVLATELGDMSRFKNVKGLFSYTGLTPSEYSSGESVRRGHISRQGAPRLRKILTELAWRAIRIDGALAEIYERIAGTRGGKRAIVAVARRLVGRIRACFRTSTMYALGTVSTAP